MEKETVEELNMLITDRHGEAIDSLEAWKIKGKPASESHWVVGRSAYELASAWIEGDAQEVATQLLEIRPELAGLRLDAGVAEKKTYFDSIRGGPRNHDLLLSGSCDEGPVVIGVEGKADEPFDQTLEKRRATALKNTPNSRAGERIDGLTKHFFGTTVEDDSGEPALRTLGYQLLSALAGTLADAKEHSANQCVLLIHEFVTDQTDDAKHELNERSLSDFLVRLYGDSLEKKGNDNAWITGPKTVVGDGEWLPKETQVFVGKLVTRKRTS